MRPRLRDARPEDVEGIAALLRRSITELCAADHRGDPDALAAWLANKTPQAVGAWLVDPGQRMLLAEIDGRLAGVGAVRSDGWVLLNYVSPEFLRSGVGAAVLDALEGWAAAQGAAEVRLESTATARAFYRARGYRESGPSERCDAVLVKALALPPPGLVIFDCDGVLVDSEPIAMRLLLKAIAGAGLALDPATGYDRFLGRSLADTREILAEEFGVRLDDAALAAMRAELYAAFRAELRPAPGVPEALAALAPAYCVASSSQPERIETSLRAAGLWECFAGRAFSAVMVARGKPAPDLFLHAAAVMGFAPASCLVVEDSPAGIRAAQAAGMRAVAFAGGGHAHGPAHRAALEALGPERVIADMRALVPVANGAA